MSIVELTGYLAATLTTASFIPQAFKVIKTKNTQSISLIMYIMFTLGVALWLAYGVFISNLPIIIANAITCTLSSIILYFKITEGKT